ncbi:uncharacterized protein LOC131013459 isoform X2 [Salvia miltiorrhiza]|uniref:uncharacterized protein LOC131013457 isoform X2 n=1 Tax=Salvia miltiorrhiza TaxID=226208 RepID=UPI0025ABF65D|nr:uncharacterized protein LOC131013457 isoform X2 [Salvia miltiorrhiza]XP_057797534.1 uncharacterized protein LOC131013459 isoform X2 [Salvia miltiorrhiza]
MTRSLVLLLASLFLSVTATNAVDSPADSAAPPSCSDHWSQKSIACEVEGAKLKFARLESILEEKIGDLNARTQYFGDCQRRIEELTSEIDRLKTVFSDFEEDQSRKNVNLSALEEEVRLLWAASRKNNFEIYGLEQKAFDAERRLKAVASQVEETSQIVSEQWIQIQKLEQALYMVEVRTSKIRKELWKRCPVVKFFVNLYGDFLKTLMGILDPYVPRDGSMFAIVRSQAFQTFATVKHYHHQVIASAFGVL